MSKEDFREQYYQIKSIVKKVQSKLQVEHNQNKIFRKGIFLGALLGFILGIIGSIILYLVGIK